MHSKSFDPIVPKNSKLLILGTMPGVKSLEMQQYYAHERNLFWPIIFLLFEKEFTNDYAIRCKLLIENKIALWDTLKFCLREGSLDSKIKNAEPNEISMLLKKNPTIKSVIFNGKSAEKYYKKFHQNINTITYYCLPSTSPANAGIKTDHKINAWSVIKKLL